MLTTQTHSSSTSGTRNPSLPLQSPSIRAPRSDLLWHSSLESWKSIWSARGILEKGLCRRVGKGDLIAVWEDLFNAEVVKKILQIPLATTASEDFQVWRGELSGIFSVRSAYKLLQEDTQIPINLQTETKAFYKKLWNLQIPSKIKASIWGFSWNYFPTFANLKKKRIVADAWCPRCKLEEDYNHIFRECYGFLVAVQRNNVESSAAGFGLSGQAETNSFTKIDKQQAGISLIKFQIFSLSLKESRRRNLSWQMMVPRELKRIVREPQSILLRPLTSKMQYLLRVYLSEVREGIFWSQSQSFTPILQLVRAILNTVRLVAERMNPRFSDCENRGDCWKE